MGVPLSHDINYLASSASLSQPQPPHQNLIFYSSGISFWLVTLSSDVTRAANIPPSCACIKALVSEYRSLGTRAPLAALPQHQPQVTCPPRSQPALRLHRGLTARQRALSVYRASSKGHWNQRLLLISTHFSVIGPTMSQLILSILFAYSYTNYLFQLPPTVLLNSAYLDCSPLKEGTTQTGEVYLASFILNHQGSAPALRKQRSQCLLPWQWQHLNLHTPGYEFTALWQMATPNRDQRQDPSTISGCSKCLRLMAQHLPWLTTRQWDKSQRFHCLTDFS